MRALVLAVALSSFLLPAAPASAAVLIGGDNGGKMEDYTSRYRQVRDSGEQVVIDGTCMSACTMVLGLVPRERICATPNAALGFHAAWEYDRSGARIASPSGTRDLMQTYPPALRAWISRHGGLTPNLIVLRGRELAAIVPPCAGAARSASAARLPRARTMGGTTGGDRASLDAR
jgi:hypothetical protein